MGVQNNEEWLRRISAQARCLLWSAEVEERGGELLEWDMQFPEEEAAERFFPVHREPGQPYQQAWYFSRLEADRQRTDAYGNREVRAGRSYSQEFRCRRQDGELRWLAEDVQIETVAPGRWRAVGVCLDITDRKRLEDALQDSHDLLEQQAAALVEVDRLKDEFLATLGHELRSPLGAISYALHILDQIGSQEERAARQREAARRQVNHLSRLAEDLLDVSRIARGSLELREERIDLRVVADNAVQTSRPLIDSRQHELHVVLPPTPLPIEADAVRLEQVVTNLLNNAAKYTKPGGRIRLTVAQEGEQAVIRVHDTGRGIPPEMLRRVFDPFTQVKGSRDSEQGGLGLGLSLVRRLVELHGGSVTARSDGPGKGSEFVVRLPLKTV
jgi:signal transduction histidine kinase